MYTRFPKIFLLILFVVTSCYFRPEPIFKLRPQTKEGIWFWGNHYLTKETDSIQVILAYDRSFDRFYRFHFGVVNKGHKNFLISPEQFYYLYRLPGKNIIFKVYAIDPESQLENIDLKISQENAHYHSTKSTRAFFGLVGLIASIAGADDQQDSPEISTDDNSTLEDAFDDFKIDWDHEKKLKWLNHYRSLWQNDALRKTTLPPGYQIKGNLFFPIAENASSMEIHIIIGGQDFIFNYKQARTISRNQ